MMSKKTLAIALGLILVTAGSAAAARPDKPVRALRGERPEEIQAPRGERPEEVQAPRGEEVQAPRGVSASG
jgi:hypothetical protein